MKEQSDVRGSYDRVAEEYARRLFHELDHKPFDREMLNTFAERVRGSGPVHDLGCGPGHVARYLHERGVEVTGIDLSGEMVRRARELNPGIEFLLGDMRSLGVPDGSLAGMVAFYSIIHIEPDARAATFAQLHRALREDAPFLLAFHIGDGVTHLDEWMGQQVAVDFYFLNPERI